jgi:hypothetical protein
MWLPPPVDPTALPPADLSALRIRREGNSRDAVNSRVWDSFHATPPLITSSKVVKETEGPRFMDMNPISSRLNSVNYRRQIDYFPNTNEPPPATFSASPYLQRMDSEGSDARNIIRELRGAVVEDNRDRQVDASRLLAERQMTDRWMPQKTSADIASLEAYELLRPKRDEWDRSIKKDHA